MAHASINLRFLINLARAQAMIGRRFDSRLGHGLSLNDFTILYHLSQTSEGKMRRIDLADKIGLTASGVTRLLLPMEKIGLVSRVASENDGRVSYVKLSKSGRQFLEETIEKAELIALEILPPKRTKKLRELSAILSGADA